MYVFRSRKEFKCNSVIHSTNHRNIFFRINNHYMTFSSTNCRKIRNSIIKYFHTLEGDPLRLHTNEDLMRTKTFENWKKRADKH